MIRCAAIPDEFEDYVFYHEQDAESVREENAVYLTWSGDGYEIAKAFRDVGLAVEWNGSKQRRIRVKAPASMMRQRCGTSRVEAWASWKQRVRKSAP
jgi:hypothetical protein